MSSPRTRPRRPLSRREFVRRVAALSGGAYALPQLSGRALSEAWAQTAGTVLLPENTTLERTIVTVGNEGYLSLGFGPPWPITVRTDLGQGPKSGRGDRRVALATLFHVTDFQLVDAQSPARVEFFDRTEEDPATGDFNPVTAAQRPQEFLIVHTVEALIRRAREVARGPVTGRPVDATISTGDNIDNIQTNELRWFMTLMDGTGSVAANSGADDLYESVQTFSDTDNYEPSYWHPLEVDDPRAPDDYRRQFGFPGFPGIFEAVRQPFTAAGLVSPWYSLYGNHDALVQGNVQPNALFNQFAVGPVKVLGPPPGRTADDFFSGLVNQDPETIAAISLAPATEVTADPERAFIEPSEYIQAHLDSPARPGPRGHGFTEDNLEGPTFYYTFDVGEQIRGISLDTTSPATSEGSIPQSQLDWLEQRLIEVHSRYFDTDGTTEVTSDNDDRLVIVFSHHRPASMQPIQGPDASGNIEQRSGGDAVIELLHRFPNVILWVNGHSHFNRIVAHGHDDPVRGFWDLTTAAQIDPPQQARMLEVVDNRDGTLSIFTTIVDHAGPPQTSTDDYSVLGLAAISREASFNDFQADPADATGGDGDRNTELLVKAAFTVTEPAPPPDEASGQAPDDTPALPATGAGFGAAAVGAAVSGALALRRRGGR